MSLFRTEGPVLVTVGASDACEPQATEYVPYLLCEWDPEYESHAPCSIFHSGTDMVEFTNRATRNMQAIPGCLRSVLETQGRN